MFNEHIRDIKYLLEIVEWVGVLMLNKVCVEDMRRFVVDVLCYEYVIDTGYGYIV